MAVKLFNNLSSSQNAKYSCIRFIIIIKMTAEKNYWHIAPEIALVNSHLLLTYVFLV